MQSFVAEAFFRSIPRLVIHMHIQKQKDFHAMACCVQLVCATDAKNPRPDPRLEDMLGTAVSTCLVTVAMSQLGDSSGLSM